MAVRYVTNVALAPGCLVYAVEWEEGDGYGSPHDESLANEPLWDRPSRDQLPWALRHQLGTVREGSLVLILSRRDHDVLVIVGGRLGWLHLPWWH